MRLRKSWAFSNHEEGDTNPMDFFPGPFKSDIEKKPPFKMVTVMTYSKPQKIMLSRFKKQEKPKF